MRAEAREPNFSNDQMSGLAKITWIGTGATYSGEWYNGIRTGKGVMTYANKSQFIGTFANNKEGTGKMTWPSPASFQGSYEAGQNKAKYCWDKPDCTGTFYEGDWSQDKLRHGNGVQTYVKNGKTSKYVGQY
jgi:hypothetical protein